MRNGEDGGRLPDFPQTVRFEILGATAYVRCVGTLCGRQERRLLTWPGMAGDMPAVWQVRHILESKRDSMGNDETGFFDTGWAADYLGLSRRTLDGYRVSGERPAFHRFGNRVRYHRPDLDAWATKRRTTTTAEADRLADR